MTPSPPETRASLILRLPDAGDVSAWDEFVALYGPLIFRLARLRGLQQADAEDIVQEVLGSVAKSVSQWLDRSDRGSFRAWLFRIARNTTINFLTRRATRSLGIDGADGEQVIGQVKAPSEEVSGLFELEYRREIFRAAAKQVQDAVTEATWQAFWMTHVEQQSINDVAKQLGISSGNVYIARSRVMSRLKEQVQQFENTDSV